jgi:hypothetical protein
MPLIGSMLASWLFFMFNISNRQLMGPAVIVMTTFGCVACFLILEETNRSHAKALQLLEDQRNSSSPHWDGYVRSAKDIEPRLKLLRSRMAQDQSEISRILAEKMRRAT